MLGSVVQVHLSPPRQLKLSPASRGFFSSAHLKSLNLQAFWLLSGSVKLCHGFSVFPSSLWVTEWYFARFWQGVGNARLFKKQYNLSDGDGLIYNLWRIH